MALDKTEKKLLAMLEGEDPFVKQAAAIILGELRVSDRNVVAALLALLAIRDRDMRLAALHGLRGARSKQAAPLILPLLESRDEAVRAAAGAAIGACGSDIVKVLRKEFASAAVARRRGIIDALAWSPGSESFNMLFEVMAGDDDQLAFRAMQSLAGALDDMKGTDVAAIRKRANTLVTDRKFKNKPRARYAGIILLGEIGKPEDLKLLLKLTDVKEHPEVRAAAMGSLRKPLMAAPAQTRSAAKNLLLQRVADDELDGVVRPAIDLLRGVELGDEHVSTLLDLAEGAHSIGREYALQHLGQMDTAAVGKVLVKHLETGEPTVREAAARSLKQMPAAVPTLVKALISAKSEDTATWLAGVLRGHAKQIKPAQRKELAKATADWAAKGDPRGEAVAELMRTVDPESREDALLKKARALAGRKKWEEAYQAVRPLSRDGRLSRQARFELGVLGVKAAGKRLATARRGHGLHDSLQPFEQLADSDFPLVEEIFKSKYLSDEDRFHIGFRFLETIEEVNKDFGAEVLERVAKKSPRTKVGKAAKNKLKLAGLLD